MVKLRQKLSVVNNQRSKPTPRLNLDRLKRADVAEGYAAALGEALTDDNTAMLLGDHWHGNLLTDERKVIERWKCYFEVYLKGAETGEVGTSSRTSQQQQQHSNNISDSNSAGDEVPPPSLDEIANAIEQVKSNKVAVSDGLAAELFKMGPERLTVEMHQLITRIWEQEELPEQWKLGVIHPIYKKGDKLECSSYRAISVLNTAYKILSQILFCRLAPFAMDFVGSYKAGFVGGKSTTDQIFTLRRILQKCRERQIPTHHLFIDFKAAYDTIDRNELWNIM
ncbi:uncharacterized protein LOC118504301 [Anopheles stephensi]|uniref:uncharacterized protein LOC118504301 n=1 Tax=Anopheles stephensi TaxID=30069 RepID=UPI0016587FC5|nr:uncharacterized protein LOC118504301 [Anopheles stephensi]